MEKRLCKKCNQEKYVDEFYSGNKTSCKVCQLAYQREWYNEKRMRKAVRNQSCMGCGVVMRNPKSKLCNKCSRDTKKWDIKTSADYHLPKDSEVARFLALLHACGHGELQDFLDKCFTATDAFIEELSREPMTHVNDVDPNAIEKYEDHESNWYQNTVLKSPRPFYRKGK